jgi:plastocyanin
MKSRTTRKYLAVLAVVALAVLFAMPSVVLSGPPDSATMVFGRPDLGSGCSPIDPDCNDQSFHAVDKIQPGSVTISTGGTVNFVMAGFHQVAIYEAGIKPNDIQVDEDAFPFVNDPNGRIFLGGLRADEVFVFTEPGKYLVICEIAPHFEEAQMWGWVHVQ